MNYSSFPHSLPDEIPRSKKVTKRRRRSVAKDRKAIAITRVSWPSPETPPDGPLVTNPTPPITHPLPANDDTKVLEKPERLQAWEHTTDVAKVVFSNRALAMSGRAYAFTLDLSPKEIAAANDNAKGFTDYFKRRISRNLKRMAGVATPIFLFGVDVNPAGRLHLHGGIEANDNDLDAIKAALVAAGGVWAHKRGQHYQCDLQPMYTPDVWADYCLHGQAKVRRIITGKAISIAMPLRRRAKELWSLGSSPTVLV